MPAPQYNIAASAGGQWAATFTLENDDGTPMNIATKTFEFVARTNTAPAGTPVVTVTSTGAGADGYMVIDVDAATVQVVLTPTATTNASGGGIPYTLWMNPGLTDATALVTGTLYSSLVAQP